MKMNIIFRLLLTLNSTSLLLLIFLIKEKYVLCQEISEYFSYALYAVLPILMTFFSILLCSKLGKDSFKCELDGNGVNKSYPIKEIEYANNSFLPSYLGYFFVALSVNNLETLICVYITLFVFTFLSQALYFNPLFLLFGFNFYNVKTKHGASIFLITMCDYKTPEDVEIDVAYRINSYTYIERG
ncbi:hypothetical protein AO727_13670 [Acinetobacter baumannii]|nr:hypothetical protein AO727_13670 [Acinetobacter baumannii]